jgi:myosin heavy subunit
MAFTVEDFRDLLEILRQRPEWRAELLGALLGDEFLSLPQQVRELIEAQKRTEAEIAALSAEVRALAQAHRRLEEQFASYREETDRRFAELAAEVRALAEAQRRAEEEFARYRAYAEERFNRLEQAIQELAEAQRRTEEEFARYRQQTDARLDRLERGQQRLEVAFERLQKEVRNLSNTIGMTVDDEAEDMVGWVLKKRGYVIHKSVQSALINGEVDVILRATDPNGQDVTVVVEVKHRLGTNDVYRWAQRVQFRNYQRRLQEAGYTPPYLPYVFAMRFDEPTIEVVRAVGIGLVNHRGEQVEGTLLVSGRATR